MKPLSLEIAGLNSFRRKQVIEFAALLEDGLFGIFGPTGSGKSSILDAITLALYGRVRRAQGGKSGIINVREKTCSVRFTFEIDSDGVRRRYSIERVLGRASGRSEGVQTRRARLIEHVGETEIPIAEKQAEIEDRILELIGIQYDEFMRAVVLPQGAFADFLGLRPKDRAGVLQRLFGLQELGIRLSSRLKLQADDMRMMRAGIEGRLVELRACDDDAVASAHSSWDIAATAEATARDLRRGADADLEAAESLWNLLAEQTLLREREAGRATAEAGLAELRRRLERSERAAAIGAAVDALEHAAARLRGSDEAFDAAVIAQHAAEARIVTARERHEIVDRSFRADHDRLCEEIARLEAAARELAELRERAVDADAAERQRAALRNELDRLEAERAELRRQVDDSTGSITTNEARLRSVEVSREEHDRLSGLRLVAERQRALERSLLERGRLVEALDGEVAALRAALVGVQEQERAAGASLHAATTELQLQRGAVETLDGERTSIAERYRRLTSVLEMVEQLEAQCSEQEAECAGYRALVAEQDTNWKVLEHKLHGVSERHLALQVEREELKERLQAAYRRDALAVLAPQLRDGEECPLCGSLEHPRQLHIDGRGSGEVAELEAKLRHLEAQVVDARNGLDKCSQNMEKNRTTREMAVETLEKSEKALSAVRLRIDATLAAAGEALPMASSADVRRYLDEIAASGIDVRTRLDLVRARRDELEEQSPKLEKLVNDLRLRSTEIETSCRNKAEQQLDARNAATVLESEIAEIRSSLSLESGGRTAEQIEADLERLRENDRTAQHLREVIATEGRKLAVVRGELESLEQTIAELSPRHGAAASLAAHILGDIERGRATIEARLAPVRSQAEADVPLETLIDERGERRDRLARERSESEARYTEAVGDEKLSRQKVEHLASLRDRDAADRDRLERDCHTALSSAGFASVEEALGARLNEAALRELRERISAVEEELRALTARSAEVDRQIAGRSLTELELASARTRAEAAAHSLEEAIGATAAAKQELERLRDRNVEFHRFSGENAEALERERTIDQLGRFLQGDAFINFLADERLAEVCRRASRMLEELTGGRYEILSRPDEGFIVRDMGNGGVERSPGSLSGGETFVVSLALALALSDTIQMGRSPLEFFFLDEGFGTLDAELLDTVVDTLERLRSHRRTIGLITHVTTLRERVPRRLIVTPPSDGIGTAVRYEVA